jgi:two-component system NtrC family sensor kinase
MKLRTRVFSNFVLVIALFGLLGAAMAAMIINRMVVNEAQRRVRLNLRSAWSVLEGRQEQMQTLLDVLGSGDRVVAALAATDTAPLRPKFESILKGGELDFLGLTDRTGRVILRARQPYNAGDILANDPLISQALRGHVVKGFAVLPRQRLEAEGGGLEERAFTAFETTPKAKPRPKESETAGLAIVAAAPARDSQGNIVGAIYGGALLNRNNALVDGIRSIVFEDEIYKGRPLGTVTIFQWDVRVATNVEKANGNRAIGTRVSAEVYDKVLENDESWDDRAFVVNDWYLSAYNPIHDLEGSTVGILYVGVLAAKYDDMRREVWAVYGGASILLALVVLGLGVVFAHRLTGSLHRLAAAATKVSEGDLDLYVEEPRTRDEARDLTRAFNAMTASLKDREERLQAANEDLEHANSELQQLNANYLGLLGFVSHELKNTLGAVYTAACSLDAGLVGALSQAQARLAGSIRRSIENAVAMTRQYLDLARIEQGELRLEKAPLDLVNDVVRPVLDELAPALAEHRMTLRSELPEHVPLTADAALLRVVYKNLIDNALKYGREGGTIALRFGQEEGSCRLEVWNEGQGLPAQSLEQLFRKFVRFGERSALSPKGTGLGLFITREIVVKHGGSIRAESQQGQWMDFVFTLPAEAPPQQ